MIWGPSADTPTNHKKQFKKNKKPAKGSSKLLGLQAQPLHETAQWKLSTSPIWIHVARSWSLRSILASSSAPSPTSLEHWSTLANWRWRKGWPSIAAWMFLLLLLVTSCHCTARTFGGQPSSAQKKLLKGQVAAANLAFWHDDAQSLPCGERRRPCPCDRISMPQSASTTEATYFPA